MLSNRTASLARVFPPLSSSSPRIGEDSSGRNRERGGGIDEENENKERGGERKRERALSRVGISLENSDFVALAT